MINDGKRKKSRREKLIINEKGTSRSIGLALNFVQYQSYESNKGEKYKSVMKVGKVEQVNQVDGL